MKRVLLLLSNKLERRGGQVYMLDWLKHAPKEDYQFDVYFLGKMVDRRFAREFIDAGATIYCGDHEKHPRIYKNIGYIKDLHGLITTKRYDMIHIHTGTPAFSALGLTVAWVCGVRHRYSHSHTSFPAESWVKRLYYAVPRAINRCLSGCYVGVSREAVAHLFGRQAFKNRERIQILSPRIDTQRFAFRDEVRLEMRKKLSVEENFVIGHVGGFTTEKNHAFLIEVFRAVAARRGDAKLLLIGSGEKEKEVRKIVNQLGLSSKVIFAGASDQVQDYMCAMDFFALPSLHEGFSITLLEAQTSGLPCIASDAVPPEVCVTNLLQYLPLCDRSEKWAEAVLATKVRNFADRKEYWLRVQEAGFDTSSFTEIIEKLYQ